MQLAHTSPAWEPPQAQPQRWRSGPLRLVLLLVCGASWLQASAAHAGPVMPPRLAPSGQWSAVPQALPSDQGALLPPRQGASSASSAKDRGARGHPHGHFQGRLSLGDRFGVLRRPQLAMNGDLLTAGLIVLIPTVAIELTLFIGNLAAFSTSKRQLAWGIQGMAFSILGGAVTLPWILLGLQEGIAVSFIALHLALLGVGIANIVMGLQQRRQNRRVAFMPWGYVSPTGVAQGGIACAGYF